MLECFVSWVIILMTAYLWGCASLIGFTQVNSRLSNSNNEEVYHWTIDDFVIAGICALTVYAQAFSIFYKVGAVALLLVIVVDIIFFCKLKKQITLRLKRYFRNKSKVYSTFKIITCVIIGMAVLHLTALPARHYDTALYHAQSIRWIEEYGVVKGLGNLHTRFAYNSAFFSFQALFSFSFILGKSLHTGNGLIVTVFLCYAVGSAKVWKNGKATVSDFIRLSLILYMLSANSVFSSPGSDILSVGLVLYIISKWISYWEDKEDKLLLYTELCFLAVWAVSVKLSTAGVMLLLFYPAAVLIKRKEWRQIAFYSFIGIAIIAPFLARNVIISGYLIYPYSELDLFNVDWKMSLYTVQLDRNEITAWARGLRDVSRFNESIKIWFPIWYETLESWKKWWWIGIVSGGFLTLRSIYKLICTIRGYADLKDALQYILIVLTVIGCVLLWFVGAPLPRYGGGVFGHAFLFWDRGTSGVDVA